MGRRAEGDCLSPRSAKQVVLVAHALVYLSFQRSTSSAPPGGNDWSPPECPCSQTSQSIYSALFGARRIACFKATKVLGILPGSQSAAALHTRDTATPHVLMLNMRSKKARLQLVRRFRRRSDRRSPRIRWSCAPARREGHYRRPCLPNRTHRRRSRRNFLDA